MIMKAKQESDTGIVNVSNLNNNHAIQSDPRLLWIVLHKIATMCRNLRHL